MKKFKILVSAYSCDPYGISESLGGFKWLEQLLLKYNVVLFTTRTNAISIERYFGGKLNNLDIHYFEEYDFVRKNRYLETIKLGYLIFNHKLKRYLVKNKDVMSKCDITFHRTPNSLRYISCLYKFDKPFVIGPIGGGLQVPNQLEDYFKEESLLFSLRRLDRFLLKLPIYKRQFDKATKIIVSQPYVNSIVGVQYNSKITRILDVGIDTEEYKRKVIENKSTNYIRLLYVGKLRRYKGAELLLKAFSQCNDSRLVLDIVGDGEEETSLKELVQNLSLSDRVNFHGHLNKAEVLNMYDNADIFTFPTLKEGSGFVLLEAMAKSLPIITIDNGGPKYLCSDEGSVKIKLAPAEVLVKEIASAINMLASSNEVRLSMGHANRIHCVENFDWKAINRNIDITFSDILDDSLVEK